MVESCGFHYPRPARCSPPPGRRRPSATLLDWARARDCPSRRRRRRSPQTVRRTCSQSHQTPPTPPAPALRYLMRCARRRRARWSSPRVRAVSRAARAGQSGRVGLTLAVPHCKPVEETLVAHRSAGHMVRQGAARGGAPGGGPGGRGHIGGRSVGAAVGGGGRRVRGRDAARGWRRRLGPAAPSVQWWQRRGQCGAGAARGRQRTTHELGAGLACAPLNRALSVCRRALSPPPARRLRDGVQAAAVWRVGRLAAQARCGHERRAAADRRAGPGVRGGGRLVGPARGPPPPLRWTRPAHAPVTRQRHVQDLSVRR